MVQQVQVDAINLQWLEYDDKTFLDMVLLLQVIQNQAFLQTAFVDNLILAFWDKYKRIITFSMFLPYLFFLVTYITFMVIEFSEYFE